MAAREITQEDIELKRWAVFIHHHVAPIGDEFEHHLSTDCHCGPEITWKRTKEGSGFYLIVHRPYDGRD